MNRFVCIHGHFYQPPRENPKTNTIDRQPSAAPFHDWNERINAECYLPNAEAEIVDEQTQDVAHINNYAYMSFNFGPTLLQWMQVNAAETYRKVIEADKKSLEIFDGHGSAIAQAYNHMIMPLADDRDKSTQVKWGIADFKYRFNREPKGMWLPETAVDTDTLEILAQENIEFTILSPHQAKHFKHQDDAQWLNGKSHKIDTHHAYRCELPSGNSIVIFFYDGDMSHAIAFGEELENGAKFAYNIVGRFAKGAHKGLVHVATDGETYGHHRKFGNTALAYLLHNLSLSTDVRLVNYEQFLSDHDPVHVVQINENSSWSCKHGVGRWSNNCGCRIDHQAKAAQHWRKPLREALDQLRDTLREIYEKNMAQYCDDVYQVRDGYVQYLLAESDSQRDMFINKYKLKDNADTCLCLLEMQRMSMFMYTSCGWFFDDVTRIETQQILKYAARAIELSSSFTDENIEETFKEMLSKAVSDENPEVNGRTIYEAL